MSFTECNVKGYKITDAVSQAFRQFTNANYSKIENPIFYCDTIEQVKIFYKAYITLFKTQFKTPIFNPARGLGPSPANGWNDKALYIKDSVKFNRSVILKRTFNKEYNYCYSIAKIENTHKGIDDTAYEHLLNILKKDGYDLGDSRNFVSVDQLIHKLTVLASSQIYVGTNCSWLYLAEVFKIPAINTHQWVYPERD